MASFRFPTRLRIALGTTVALAALAAGASAAAGAPVSPFVPPSAAPKPAPPAADPELQALQLSGISIIGEEKNFNFVDSRSKKSFWIALGGTENGFKVESFDASTDMVTVSRNGFSRQVGLRQSKIVAVTAPAAPAAPPAPLPPLATAPDVPAIEAQGVDEIRNPQTPQQVKQAEFEARMLVSDLLEISMQERARQRALRESRAKQGQP